MPPFGPPPQADITTPEKEEILLSPMRMPGVRKNPSVLHWSKVSNSGNEFYKLLGTGGEGRGLKPLKIRLQYSFSTASRMETRNSIRQL